MKGSDDGIYLLEVNNRNSRIRCEICSKLTIKLTPERRCVFHSGNTMLTKFWQQGWQQTAIKFGLI